MVDGPAVHAALNCPSGQEVTGGLVFFADLGDGLLRVFLGLFLMTGLNRRCGVTLFFRVTE